MASNQVPANYLYWQQNGDEWPDAYEYRKTRQVLYHNQEVYLAHYMSLCAPARVLEVGCGFGRHLAYLRSIPGIEPYGFDQSPTMIAGFSRWATADWVQTHVSLGEPVGQLPYPDASFDVVYTAEALVHSRPEDLLTILRELLRVTRWQVFHLEPNEEYALSPLVHSGCWYHDLTSAYALLGHRCETLPSTYSAHRPYRVVLDSTRQLPRISSVVTTLMKRTEEALQPTLDRLDVTINTLNDRLNQATHESAHLRARVAELEEALERDRQELADLESANRELSLASAQASQLAVEAIDHTTQDQQRIVILEDGLQAKDKLLASYRQLISRLEAETHDI